MAEVVCNENSLLSYQAEQQQKWSKISKRLQQLKLALIALENSIKNEEEKNNVHAILEEYFV